MFKKFFKWLTCDSDHETVREILTPPTVADKIKTAVNNQITDAVTQAPKKKRRRKPKARKPITEGSMKGGNGVVKR